jgi:hypothetical protein
MATVDKQTTGDLICVCISRQVGTGRTPAGGRTSLRVRGSYRYVGRLYLPHFRFPLSLGSLVRSRGISQGLTDASSIQPGQALFVSGPARAGLGLTSPTTRHRSTSSPSINPVGWEANQRFHHSNDIQSPNH